MLPSIKTLPVEGGGGVLREREREFVIWRGGGGGGLGEKADIRQAMVETSKTHHFGCVQQKWFDLNLLHAMVIKFSGNQQKLQFFF